MFSKTLLLPIFAMACFAAIDEPCYGDNAQGICLSTSDCEGSGGTTIDGACPADPADVKCCSKPTCSVGNCRWQSDCAGSVVSGECPGPNDFQCCDLSDNGYGNYSTPDFPTVGECLSVSVAGAETIVEAWPGRVREIFCTRDCTCGGSDLEDDSDHCCGGAVDFMISDAGGTPTLGGNQIAEWVMENRETLDLKYVIWGQRIWQSDVDDEITWSNWEPIEDRNDITQHHWDHVHVSFNY